ncbi:MAG: hypothetical protein ACFFDT_25085 [Candidatus Hodarchaeota archaeon]
MDLAEVRRVKEKYLEELMSLKNVISVGIGRKRVQGRETEELAIIVSVTQKLPLALIKKSDLIPRVLNGVKVDVIEVGNIHTL